MHPAERWLRVLLPALALGALLAVAALWPPGDEWPWREASEIRVKAALGLGVLALVAWAELPALRPTRRARIGLGVAAALSLAAHYNFGLFHYPHFVHSWEQFHYQLGSKYFPELGYDGLYAASLAAQRERAPGRPLPREVRDLRRNALVATARVRSHERRVVERFSPARWEAFVADHAHFLRAVPPVVLDAFRRDHGYNPTPAWTAVARVWNGGLRLDGASLRALAALDVGLLLLAFAVVFRTFGARAGCLALVVFGLGYPGRFKWTGGAFLRLDWIAALALGVCGLRARRPAAAGALFGYAIAVRVFPGAFLVGPAVVAARQLLSGERPRWALRFGAGLAAALCAALLAGALAGRGPAGWSEFAERIEVHQLSRGRNLVGLENVVLFGRDVLARAAAPRSGASWDLRRQDVLHRKRQHGTALRLAQAALLVLLVAAVWRAPPAEAAVLSLAALFALVVSANYYWVALLLAPLARGRRDVLLLLALNLAFHAVHLRQPDLLVRYGLVSWGLLGLFVAWLAPDAFATLRAAARRPRAGAPGRAEIGNGGSSDAG